MRVLIVGGGGREHALAWRFKLEDPAIELIAAPGNPGIAELGECVPISATDLVSLELLARARKVDLVVVGPEAPLAAGIVDRFRVAGIPIFGPTAAAARIETSKAFAKELMMNAGVPTAFAEMHSDPVQAKAAAREFGAPVVVKASGLASGKGVIIGQTIEDADLAIDDMLLGNRFGEAGHEVLIEEYMSGEELSVFAITNGEEFVVFPGLQDHKRLRNGDAGPNTGGMGAYVPVSLHVHVDEVTNIFACTLEALTNYGCAFTGLLYAGLMLTDSGPKVVEFNCRFGDPETQALMPALSADTRLLDMMLAVASGRPLPKKRVRIDGSCVTTVLAAANYPESPRTGDEIALPAAEDNVFVFHAGTARDDNRTLRTAGGRVFAVTARAPTFAKAQWKSQEYASRITFAGRQMRTDIGWREIARASGN